MPQPFPARATRPSHVAITKHNATTAALEPLAWLGLRYSRGVNHVA